MTEAQLKKIVQQSATGGKMIGGKMHYTSVGLIPQNVSGRIGGFVTREQLLRSLKRRTGETLKSLNKDGRSYKILHLYPYVKKGGKWVIHDKKRYFLYSYTPRRRG